MDSIMGTTFCEKYDLLLHECEEAQRGWSDWRDEMNSTLQLHGYNRKVSDELLRLQAKFAKAYALLEKHNRECELCQFLTELSHQHTEPSCAYAN